jgi:PAS domain S-box-containing protein
MTTKNLQAEPSASGDRAGDQTLAADGHHGTHQSRIPGAAPSGETAPRFIAALAAATGRLRPRRWVVLVASLAFVVAAMVAIGSVEETKHILGMPGSLMALTAVVAGALGGRAVGVTVALGGGAVYFVTVADLGAHGTVLATVISCIIWVATALISSLLADALRAQSARLTAASAYSRSLLEASLDPLVTISRQGQITDVNQAAVEITGVSRDELICTDFSDYFTEPERARAGYEKVFRQGLVRDYPLVVRDAEGRFTDVVYNASVYRDEAGEVAGVFAAARDVTELKAAEAAATENARLYEQQRYIATTLQESFIHPLPQVDGLQLGLVSQTAYEPDLVGGDFADVFLMEGTLVGLLVGDVSGKGVRAAGLTETVRSTVRAFAMVDSSPGFILGKTNEVLIRDGSEGLYVTAFLLVLDAASGQTSFASAGHPAPVMAGATLCALLETQFGPPLGSFAWPYDDASGQLAPGEGLVFYSDGVTEARRDEDLFGDERLLETVCALRDRTPQELAEGVRDAAQRFADRLKDDLEVLVVRYR